MKNQMRTRIEERVKIAHALHSKDGDTDDIRVLFTVNHNDSWKCSSYNVATEEWADWEVGQYVEKLKG